jgi:hypothetical protein
MVLLSFSAKCPKGKIWTGKRCIKKCDKKKTWNGKRCVSKSKFNIDYSLNDIPPPTLRNPPSKSIYVACESASSCSFKSQAFLRGLSPVTKLAGIVHQDYESNVW